MADSVSARVNAVITGRQHPPPTKAPEPPPAWLEPSAVRQLAGLWSALRRQQADTQANDPLAIGRELIARREAVAELVERINREGWDAVVNPPAPAPKPETFTALAFAAWWNALARRGLTDGDALLLAWFVWVRLPRPEQGDGVVSFLEALAAIDPQHNPAAEMAKLRSLLAQPARPKRGRGRPKGHHLTAAAGDADVRELFAKRIADGCLKIPSCNPWHLLQDLAGEVGKIIDSDLGVTNSRHLQVQGRRNNNLIQKYLGSPHRGRPPLRSLLVIEALAERCLDWWLAEYVREVGPLST